MTEAGIEVLAASHIIRSAPIGPSMREYANGAAVVSSAHSPQDMLGLLKQIERGFGRESERGNRWQARILDLDIILWSGGIHSSPDLSVPHPQFRKRRFVLGPAAQIAGNWRDPVTNLSVRQLTGRLTKPCPVTR